MNKCIKCGKELIPNVTWNPSHVKDNWHICKECFNKRLREKYRNNPQIRERQRIYRRTNYLSVLENNRNYYRSNFLRTKHKLIRVNKRPFQNVCELCGKIIYKNAKYHHWDDKHPEKGIWVCIPCHYVVESWEKCHENLIEKYLKLKEEIENEIT
jgi:hypothetical protein